MKLKKRYKAETRSCKHQKSSEGQRIIEKNDLQEGQVKLE